MASLRMFSAASNRTTNPAWLKQRKALLAHIKGGLYKREGWASGWSVYHIQVILKGPGSFFLFALPFIGVYFISRQISPNVVGGCQYHSRLYMAL